ncbi:P-selectin glycoprotein ligand 1 [Megalops cyprinoides]|uniref:P-selectin glycoprotein ligand 1 n=1 Tax=Megalops cyprinoides TaxID=118141 RepID=UPI0018651331|nr:P-selectin glycoprotein ligand 1 [Megalops cyprinoides]
MDTVFAKMAVLWPVLLLLLALFNPLLSKHLPSDYNTGNSTEQTLNSLKQAEYSTTSSPLDRDREDNTSTTAISRKPAETTRKTYESTTPKTEGETSPYSTETTNLRSSLQTENLLSTSIERSAETPASTTQHLLSTSGTTNSSMQALVPRRDPGVHHQTTAPGVTKTVKTTAPNEHFADRDGFPCSTVTPRRDGLVGQCLIAIATLAGVATIFIVSTIILCTKLSSSKYKYRMAHNCGTEMVCISALLPDGNGTHGRPRIPKSNGALIPNTEDSEGDDLTLHSFLPETERGF